MERWKRLFEYNSAGHWLYPQNYERNTQKTKRMSEQPPRLRVFISTDVLSAGAASPNAHSAGVIVLQVAEITLIDAITSEQVISEVKRNLETKVPCASATFELLVNRSLTVVSSPSREDLNAYRGLADPENPPILVAAIQARSSWLVRFNTRHYGPGHPHVTVVRPGKLTVKVRDYLTGLAWITIR
jgi:hypothetical protein